MTALLWPAEASGLWVDAAPFRAHVRHLMAVADLSDAVIATLAGVTPAFVRHLLHGRGGRPMRRVSPDQARRLLRITTAEARLVARREVPSRLARPYLHQLQRAGWSSAALTDLLGLTDDTVRDLSAGRRATCSQLTVLRLAAAARELPRHLQFACDEQAAAEAA